MKHNMKHTNKRRQDAQQPTKALTTTAPRQCTHQKRAETDPLQPARLLLQATTQHLRITRHLHQSAPRGEAGVGDMNLVSNQF